MLLLDSGHEYHIVKAELELYAPLVRAAATALKHAQRRACPCCVSLELDGTSRELGVLKGDGDSRGWTWRASRVLQEC